MSQFYFHIRSNGILMEDQAGCAYQSPSEACASAVGAMPGLLAKALQGGSTHVTTNICNDEGSVCVVRASIVVGITTRHIAKKSAKEEALVSRFGGAWPGLPRPRSPGMPPRISPEAAPLLCTRRPGVIEGRQRMALRAGLVINFCRRPGARERPSAYA